MTDTPKPMQGTWTLIAPDGRTWQADSPLRCVAAEQRERVPASVAVERVLAGAQGLPADEVRQRISPETMDVLQALANGLVPPDGNAGAETPRLPGCTHPACDCRAGPTYCEVEVPRG